MGRQTLYGMVLGAVTLLGGVALASGDPTTTEATPPAPSAPGQGDLPLVLSIRALSLGQVPFPANVDTERIKAPTGAGTSRWPSASTEVARGVYLSVMPVCVPGIDEPYRAPVSQRAAPVRRR
jgi:hypothetical protein